MNQPFSPARPPSAHGQARPGSDRTTNLRFAIGAACGGLLALIIGILVFSSAKSAPSEEQRYSSDGGVTTYDGSDPGFAAKAIGVLLIVLAIAAFAVALWRVAVAQGANSLRGLSPVPPASPAGWYADPGDGRLVRYWSGSEWGKDAYPPPNADAPK